MGVHANGWMVQVRPLGQLVLYELTSDALKWPVSRLASVTWSEQVFGTIVSFYVNKLCFLGNGPVAWFCLKSILGLQGKTKAAVVLMGVGDPARDNGPIDIVGLCIYSLLLLLFGR